MFEAVIAFQSLPLYFQILPSTPKLLAVMYNSPLAAAMLIPVYLESVTAVQLVPLYSKTLCDPSLVANMYTLPSFRLYLLVSVSTRRLVSTRAEATVPESVRTNHPPPLYCLT